MTWDPELEELRRREALVEAMGGEEKVERQHRAGKLTIRERLVEITDPDSFREVGKLAGASEYDEAGEMKAFTPASFVFGMARLDGRPIVISGDDFTVRGGSAELAFPTKRAHAEGLAHEMRLPHVRLVDGMGGGGSVKTIEQAGRTYLPGLFGWEVIVQHLAV